MDFITGAFLLFFTICVAVYYSIPKKGQWIWLLLCSIFFYLCASVKLSIFILFSIISSFVAARRLEQLCAREQAVREKTDPDQKKDTDVNVHKKAVAALLIGSNAGLLFLLKFASSGSFFVTRLHLGRLAFLLPMGISFYTLQIIAYVVDVYRGKYPAEKNFLQYMLFVMYFPQILQGPIARFDQLKKQLCSGHTFSYATFVGGFELMIWGYFQKLVIADRAAVIVDRLFGEYRSYTGVYMLLAGVLYSIQLYTDFNGCVCIARGASEMLGITLAENFDHPYFATSIQDFWHRWHMSLSSWLRDYVYIPLGGNRKGKLRKYVNILLTFLVSGLWHGMGLTYLVWGFLHGLYQIIGSLLMPVRDRLVSLTKTDRSCFSHRLLKQLCTFFLVMLAWIFFRADSVTQALQMIRQMAVFNPWVLWNQSVYLLGLDAKNVWILFFAIVILLLVSIWQTKTDIRGWLAKQGIVFRYAVVYLALFAVLIFGIYGPGYDAVQFIYGGF